MRIVRGINNASTNVSYRRSDAKIIIMRFIVRSVENSVKWHLNFKFEPCRNAVYFDCVLFAFFCASKYPIASTFHANTFRVCRFFFSNYLHAFCTCPIFRRVDAKTNPTRRVRCFQRLTA